MPDLVLKSMEFASLKTRSQHSCSNKIPNSLASVTIPSLFSLTLTCRSRQMMAGLHEVSERLNGRLTGLYLCETFGAFVRRLIVFAKFVCTSIAVVG